MKNNSKLKIVIITVCFVLLCALMVCGFGLIERLVVENRDSGNADNNSGPNVGDVYFDGAWHTINSDVTSLLVIGVDKSVSEVEGKENSEQSDFFALVVINEKSKSYSILHINRDTVTEIKKVDSTGEVLGTFDAQLALSHTFGGNDQMRCRNSVSAVENLLYGTDITHYLSLTMDAVPILNDAAGGVTVELLDDFTVLDEEFTKGAMVTLKGDQALSYVRARKGLEDSSNLARMERQKQYITALVEKIAAEDSEAILESAYNAKDYLVSDCSLSQLSDLFERFGDYDFTGAYTLEGESVKGDEFMEFHVDEVHLQKTVVELFYKAVEE